MPQCTYHAFSGITISQGSVAMFLRCGEILNDRLIANFLDSVPVKNFQNRLILGEDMN